MGAKTLARAEQALPDPRAALERELRAALALLGRGGGLSDRAAHEFRRTLKRSRVLLRLMRDAVAQRAYEREDLALRDAARPLAAMRDARVILDGIDRLAGRKAGRGSRPRLLDLRRALRLEHDRLRAALRQSGTLGAVAGSLCGSAERTRRWRMPRPAWPVLASGLERIYRHGRKALRDARARPGERALHELRKHVKRLGTALEFLQPAAPRHAKKLAKTAAAAADALGEDHDLALLQRRARGARLDPALHDRLSRRRRKLQKKGLERARRLYLDRPGKLVARLPRAR